LSWEGGSLVSVELLELLGSLCAPLAALPGGREEGTGLFLLLLLSSLSLCARAEREIGRRGPSEVGVPVVQTGAGR
jgi:hypothetical protein